MDDRSEIPGWLSIIRETLWLRAALLHPFLLVAPLVGICRLLAAREGSELSDVAWGLWVIEIAAVVSFVWTRRMSPSAICHAGHGR